jgi:xanthine dehydrogenase accessory factor
MPEPEPDFLARAYELARRGEPFALATVVRCERPTSAKPGAKALVHADGTVTGWIGGSCAEPLVVREGLAALRDGQPRLVSLVGPDGHHLGPREGVTEHAMSCHSGGTLEIYVEPVLQREQLVLLGSGPVVETLARLAAAVGLAVATVDAEGDLGSVGIRPGAWVVVATHGRFDEDALAHALRSEARYVSLVASPKRAAAVREALQARGLPADGLARLKAPAGLDLGAVTPEEIAVSILAEIVRQRRSGRPEVAETAARPVTEARDPICGMLVEIATAVHRSEARGETVYFCCRHCKETFDRNAAPR